MLTHLKTKVAGVLKQSGLVEPEMIELIESPKRPGHGQLSLPVFSLAKRLQKAPPLIAQEVAAQLHQIKPKEIAKIEAVSGFVNFHFTPAFLGQVLMTTVTQEGAQIGNSERGAGRSMVIDYSSPNVAKPMHIGHLRATVIGQAIVNLAKSQGYKVTGLNHLGDWGVQFGNLAWAYQHWAKEYDFANRPFESLYELYVRFHGEAETDEELARQGAEMFNRLEQGDPEVEKLWRMVVDISMKEYSRLWKRLGVQHDLVRGESFYNDKMAPVEEKLEKSGLLVESDGAMVVRLDEEGMAPCLVRKTDGASLYATRELASAIYRVEGLSSDLNLYVVGAEQTLHFRQIFRVLEKMGYAWVKNCHHISFGMYRFKDVGRMSSRKGNVIFLEDVLDRAVSMVREIISAKNPNLANKELVAEQVGIGAIIFNDLMNDRVKNVDFDWDRVLDFEGDSGPYVQYCYVRCNSLLAKYGRPAPVTMSAELGSAEELELMRHLMGFHDTLFNAFDNFKPHILAGYLIDVCRLFSQFYTKHRILNEPADIESSRMALVGATRLILRRGLEILNMQAPDAM